MHAFGAWAAAHLTHPLHARHQNAKRWTADFALPQTLQALCCRVALGTCEVWKGFQGVACKGKGAAHGDVLKQGLWMACGNFCSDPVWSTPSACYQAQHTFYP